MSQPRTPRVSAQPPSFHLTMRLIDDLQQPLQNKDYVLEWGNRRISGQTDAHGQLEHPNLDGHIAAGSLYLGSGSGDNFVAHACIPVIKFVLSSSTNTHTQPYWRLHNLGFTSQPGSSAAAGSSRRRAVALWRQSRGHLGPDFENPNSTSRSPSANTGFLNQAGESALRREHDLAEDPQGG